MYYVKDSPLELGHRMWQLRPPKPTLIVVVKGTFDPAAGSPAPFAEEPVFPTGEMHWEDDVEQSLCAPSDFSLLKPRGECFVVGKAWAPGGQPATAVACRFKIGPVEKRFGVFGDRRWSGGLVHRLSDPEPFTEMDLRMERAYGGPGHEPNPWGRGREEVDGVHFAPNLEQLRDPVQSPTHKVEPVVVGPLPMSWPDRMKYAGTYDQRYLDERWPWLAEDLDWRFFLAAPRDQQLSEGFWRGDERVELEGLHPTEVEVRSRLPAITPRVFLHRDGEGAARPFEEVPLQLDTVTWDGAIGRLLLTWRGLVEVADEQLEDLAHIFVAHDPLGGPARTPEQLKARLDELLAAEEAEEEEAEGEEPPEDSLDDAGRPTLEDAGPPAMEGQEEEEEEEEAGAVDTSAEEAELATKMAELNAQLLALGVEPPAVGEAPAARPDPAQLLADMKANGFEVPPELEQAVQDMDPTPAGPDEREPPAEDPAADEAEGRAIVTARLAAGEPLTELDLTGSDLSGLDLSEQDLEGSILKRANLGGTKLARANLAGCDLSEANLLKADLSGAVLRMADLGEANLQWVDFLGADLEDATLDDARLVESRLESAKALRATFMRADLTQAVLKSGDFSEADFEGAILRGVDATEAVFRDTILEEVKADGARFDRAVMTQARCEGLEAREARFGTIDAEDSFWERAVLSECDFSFARLTRADFSDASLIGAEMDACLLRGARFDRANAHGLVARKADLMEASFESADLSFADLRSSNLFGAQLWRAKTKDAQLDFAILTRTSLDPG